MADILISQLPAGSPLLTDLLILANPTTGIAKKSTVTQLNNVLTLVGLSDVAQVTPPANSILEWDEGFTYITNVARASGVAVGFVPTFSALSPIELTSSNLKQTDYGFEISDDNYLNNASVLFGLSSNSKGFLMPRLATTDRTDIISPPKGLEVFDTTLNIPFYYNGTSWKGVQEVLISGTNLKTINNTSLLGSGNISTIQAWGSITGTLSNQTDLQNALNAKQATLISGTNIKTINGTTLLGSGDLVVASGITTLNTLTASTQSFAVGSSGTDFTISSATSTHTFNLPTASASARGLLSSANWTTFNNKVGGSGTTNYISKFTASGTIGNSLIYDNGVGIEINGPTKISTASQYVLEVGNSTGPTSTSSFVLGNAGYYYTTINAIRPGGNFATNLTFTTCASGSPTAIEAMRITSDQKLLIGTTTDNGSGAQLQVYGNINAPYIIASNDLYGNNVRVNGIYPNTLTYLPFLSNQSPYGEIMRVNNNGSLWINRTTDDGTGAKLQVNGGFSQNGANDNNYFAGKLNIGNLNISSYKVDITGYFITRLGAGGPNFAVQNNGGSTALYGGYSDFITNTDDYFVRSDGTNVVHKIPYTGGFMLFNTSTATAMKLLDSGNFLINRTSDDGTGQKLQITGNISLTTTTATGVHTATTQHLPIYVNGTLYYIQLLN